MKRRKSRSVLATATVVTIGLIAGGIWGIGAAFGGIANFIRTVNPPPEPSTPIWVWALVGIAALMLLKTFTRRRPEYSPPPPGY